MFSAEMLNSSVFEVDGFLRVDEPWSYLTSPVSSIQIVARGYARLIWAPSLRV
jgi:hypothetical protein